MNLILSEDIKKELSIDEQGKTFASRRAVARLCGLGHNSINNLLKNLVDNKPPSKVLQTFAGQSFDGGQQLPDTLVAAIVAHYAYRGNEQAQSVAIAFQSIGIRAWIQQEMGWKKVEQPKQPQTELDLIDRLFADFADTGVKPELVKAAKFEAIAKAYPQLREAAEIAKRLLASTSAIDELPMSPTELGKAIAQQLNLEKIPSALKINEVLVIQGLQEVYYRKNSKGETCRDGYRLTERGKQYGQLEQTAGKNSDGVRLQVRWHRSVVEAIAPRFSS